jgi:hypothetical protein
MKRGPKGPVSFGLTADGDVIVTWDMGLVRPGHADIGRDGSVAQCMWRGGVGILLLGCVAVAPESREARPYIDEPEPAGPAYRESGQWMESLVEPPAFPTDEHLVEFDLAVPDPQFIYRIDAQSLQIGEDGVVRYVLVIEPRQGIGRNLLFEAMNCATAQYKPHAYGYGTATGEWRRPLRAPEWLAIPKDGGSMFRYDLRTLYFCDLGVGRALPLTEILHRLKTRPTFHQNSFFENL